MPMNNQNQNYMYGYYPQMAQAQQPVQNVPYGAQMQPAPARTVDLNTPTELRWVSGEIGAVVESIQPGSCVLLMDATPSSNKFWLKAVGTNGVPTPLREFTWQECQKQTPPQITYGDQARNAQPNQEIEGLKKEMGSLKNDLAAIRKFMEDLK